MDVWDEAIIQRLKAERPLNFSTIHPTEDDDEFSDYSSARRKIVRDPMSHRIIEKRRRDRMNNCLADLSRLIPTTYLKKGRGRIEKTEIIEMAIKHLKHLQAHSCQDPNNCEVNKNAEQERLRQYNLGYQECMSETVRFLVENEGMYPREGVCFRLITHLHQHYDKVGKGHYPQSSSEAGFIAAERIRMEVDIPICPEFVRDVVHIKRSPSPYPNEPQQSEKEDINYTHNSSNRESSCGGGSSQLREMLQNPGLPLERLRSNSTTRSGYPTTSSLYSVAYLASKGEEVYKFKNNIKERFHADKELSHSNNPPENDSERYQEQAKKYPAAYGGISRTPAGTVDGNSGEQHPISMVRKDPNSVNGSWDTQMDSNSSNCSTNSSPNTRSNCSTSGYSTEGVYAPKRVQYAESAQPSDCPRVKPGVVPIFALHPKGSFYIPLTLDIAVIAPHFDALGDAVPVLHPISISVNFCSPVNKRRLWASKNFPSLSEQCGGGSGRSFGRMRSSSLVLPNPATHKATVVQ